jgi:hypothetical protein
MLLDPTNPDIWYEPERPANDFKVLLIQTHQYPPDNKSACFILRLQITKDVLDQALSDIRALRTKVTSTGWNSYSGWPGHSLVATAEATIHHRQYPTKACRNLRWNVDGDRVWLTDETFIIPWKCTFRQRLQTSAFRAPELVHALRLDSGKPYLLHSNRHFPAMVEKLNLRRSLS